MSTVPQFFRYVVVGVLNTTLDFLIFNALSIAFDVYAGTPIIPINMASAAVVITQSYYLNKRWTFGARNGQVRVEFLKFLTVNILTGLLNTAIVYALTTFVAPPGGIPPLLWENAAKAVALGANIVLNFFGFKLFVFRG